MSTNSNEFQLANQAPPGTGLKKPLGKTAKIVLLKAFMIGYLAGIGAALLLYVPFDRMFPRHQDAIDAIAWKICPFIAFGLGYWPQRWMLDVEIIASNGLLYALVITTFVAAIYLINFVYRTVSSRTSGVRQ